MLGCFFHVTQLFCAVLISLATEINLYVKGLPRYMFNLFEILFLLFPLLQETFNNLEHCNTHLLGLLL